MDKINMQQLNPEIRNKLNSIGNKSNLNTNYKEDLVGAINEVNENVNNHTHDASDITSGVFHIDRIPNIPANKITGKVASAANADNANTVGGMTVEEIVEEGRMRGSPVLVTSNTLQESFDTERSISAAIGQYRLMLVAKHIIRGTGEIKVSFDMYTNNGAYPAQMYIPIPSYNFSTLGFGDIIEYDWQTPIGRIFEDVRGLGGAGSNYISIAKTDESATYQSFNVTLQVYVNMPIYLFLYARNSSTISPNTYVRCRNIRFYYDLI